MMWFGEAKIYIDSGILQNCSAQNFTIFTFNNSSLYLVNMQFYDFHSQLIYSGLGFLSIDSCFFSNDNCRSLGNDFAIKLEKYVSCIFRKSQFSNLDNFAKVKNLILCNNLK